MAIVRSYDKKGKVINEYVCEDNKEIVGDDGYPISEVDYYILVASYEAESGLDGVIIEDSDGSFWSPI